jgi:hypothetical protein
MRRGVRKIAERFGVNPGTVQRPQFAPTLPAVALARVGLPGSPMRTGTERSLFIFISPGPTEHAHESLGVTYSPRSRPSSARCQREGGQGARDRGPLSRLASFGEGAKCHERSR